MATNNAANNKTAASGKVLQGQGVGTASDFSTATYPSTATSTGTLLRADGTDWKASTSTIPDTFAQGDIIYASAANVLTALNKNASATRYMSNTGTTNNPEWAQIDLTNGVTGALPVANGGTGNTSKAAFSLVCGGTTTTGAFQAVNPVAVGQVLVSSGTGALPAFSASPSVTSITLSGGTALNTYIVGTYTPSLTGQTTGPTVGYLGQIGSWTKIGNRVFVDTIVEINSLSGGSGNVLVSLPFTSSGTYEWIGNCYLNSATFVGSLSIRAPVSFGSLQIMVTPTAGSAAPLQISGITSTFHISSSICYQY